MSSGTFNKEGCETTETSMTLSNAKSNTYRPMQLARQLSPSSRGSTLTAEAVARSGEFLHSLLLQRGDDFVQRRTSLCRTMVREPFSNIPVILQSLVKTILKSKIHLNPYSWGERVRGSKISVKIIGSNGLEHNHIRHVNNDRQKSYLETIIRKVVSEKLSLNLRTVSKSGPDANLPEHSGVVGHRYLSRTTPLCPWRNPLQG
jgi:hypothetical protein